MATLRHQRSRGQLTMQGTPRLSPIASIVSSPSLSSSSDDDTNEDDLVTPTADSVREAQHSLGYFSKEFSRRSSFSSLERPHKPVPERPAWPKHMSVRKLDSTESLRSQYSQFSQYSDGEAAKQRNSRFRNLLLSRSRKYIEDDDSTPSQSGSGSVASASASEESLWGTPVDAHAVAEGLVAPPASWSPEKSQSDKAPSPEAATVESNANDNTYSSKTVSNGFGDESSITAPARSPSADTSIDSTVASIETSLSDRQEINKQRLSPLMVARRNVIADTKLLISKSAQKTCDRCHKSQKGLWIWSWTSQLLCQWCLDVQAKRVPLELKTSLLERSQPIDSSQLQSVDLVALSRIANSLPHAVLLGLVPSSHSRLKARPSAPDDSFMDMKSRGASHHLMHALHNISLKSRYGFKLRRSASSASSDRLLGAVAGAMPALASAHAQRQLAGATDTARNKRRIGTARQRQSLLPYVSSESSSNDSSSSAKEERRTSDGSSSNDSSSASPGDSSDSNHVQGRHVSTMFGKARSTDTFFSSDSELSPPWHSGASSSIDASYSRAPTKSSDILHIDARFKEASGVYVGMLGIDWRPSLSWDDKHSNDQSSSPMVLYTYPDDVLICTGCSADHLIQDDRAYILRSELQDHLALAHDSLSQRLIPLERRENKGGDWSAQTYNPTPLSSRDAAMKQQLPQSGSTSESVGPNTLGLTSARWGDSEGAGYDEDSDEDDDPAMTYY